MAVKSVETINLSAPTKKTQLLPPPLTTSPGQKTNILFILLKDKSN